MKILSKRKIIVPVNFLRIFFFIIASLIIYFLNHRIYDYAVFFGILLIPASIAAVNQVIISEYDVVIKKYLFFGFIKKIYVLNLPNILFMSIKEETIELDDPGIYDVGFTFLSSTREVSSQVTEFKFLNKNNDIECLAIKLGTKEYQIASDILASTRA